MFLDLFKTKIREIKCIAQNENYQIILRYYIPWNDILNVVTASLLIPPFSLGGYFIFWPYTFPSSENMKWMGLGLWDCCGFSWSQVMVSVH